MTLRRFLIAPAAALALALAPTPATSQLTPADSASVLLDTAARFARDGRGEVAQALYRYIVQHFADTPAAVEARGRLRAGPATSASSEGDGRVELQVWTTLYGLWMGVAVPGAFGADGSEPYGLGLLVGGPAGFLAGKGIARSRPITLGQARAVTLGGSWGTWQGFGWTDVLNIGEGYTCDYDLCSQNDAAQARFAGMIVGGLAGIGVGTLLARRDISPGAATTVNFGALWGTWFGFAGGYLLGLENDNLLAATLVGGDAGLVWTAVMAPRWQMSRSRARLVSIYGVMGGLAGLGVDLITQPEGDKTAVAVPLVGSIAGLAVGWGVTGDYDSTHSPGDGGGPEGTALLRLAEGRWSVGAPLPLPTRLPLEGVRRPASALRINLLEARFR